MSLPPPGPDSTAVVTGASSGIGEQFARELARRGHHVTLVARSADKLQQLADELERAPAPTSCPPISPIATSGPNLLGRLSRTPDILINNAGFSTLGPVTKADPADEIRMLEVDVVAVADLCSRFVPGMVQRKRGAVLNVASTAAFQPLPGQAGYAAAKSFVLSYTQSLAGELRGTGVTATVLCPGPVDTNFADTAGFTPKRRQRRCRASCGNRPRSWRDAASTVLARGRMVAIPGVANRVAARLRLAVTAPRAGAATGEPSSRLALRRLFCVPVRSGARRGFIQPRNSSEAAPVHVLGFGRMRRAAARPAVQGSAAPDIRV